MRWGGKGEEEGGNLNDRLPQNSLARSRRLWDSAEGAKSHLYLTLARSVDNPVHFQSRSLCSSDWRLFRIDTGLGACSKWLFFGGADYSVPLIKWNVLATVAEKCSWVGQTDWGCVMSLCVCVVCVCVLRPQSISITSVCVWCVRVWCVHACVCVCVHACACVFVRACLFPPTTQSISTLWAVSSHRNHHTQHFFSFFFSCFLLFFLNGWIISKEQKFMFWIFKV